MKIADIDTKYEFLVENYKKAEDDVLHFNELLTCIEYGLYDNLDKLFEKYCKLHIYDLDCYNTNKKLHIINILASRGFIIEDSRKHMIKLNADELRRLRKDIKADKSENFDEHSSTVTKLNEYLKVPNDKINDYKGIFLDQYQMINHLNISRYFFTSADDNIKNLNNLHDFDIKKCEDARVKMIFLDEMLKRIDIDKSTLNSFKPHGKVIEKHIELEKKYLELFRIRTKDFNLSSDINIYKFSCKIINILFNDILKSKQVRFTDDGPRMYIYSVDADILKFHKELFQYRQKCKTVINKKLFKKHR